MAKIIIIIQQPDRMKKQQQQQQKEPHEEYPKIESNVWSFSSLLLLLLLLLVGGDGDYHPYVWFLNTVQSYFVVVVPNCVFIFNEWLFVYSRHIWTMKNYWLVYEYMCGHFYQSIRSNCFFFFKCIYMALLLLLLLLFSIHRINNNSKWPTNWMNEMFAHLAI